jgi:hypothetical protein
VVGALLAACGSSHSQSDHSATVELRTSELTVTVRKAPFNIAIADSRGALLAEASNGDQGSLAYWRGADAQHVVQASDPYRRDADRVSGVGGAR